MHTSLILLVVFLLNVIFVHLKLKKCPDSKLFWSAFSRIWTEYGKILRISPYSVRMRENADQTNSECGHFLRSVSVVVGTLQLYRCSPGSIFS